MAGGHHALATSPNPTGMAQQEDTISHLSHPGHELVKRHYTGPSFHCDMCLEHLSGPGYGCSAGCDFAIHEACAGHRQTLTSPEHHAHPLVLVQTRRDATRLCDVCLGRCAPGCFLYRCPPCGFDMHPRCARLPQAVRSSRHPAHDLTLVVTAADGRCAACDERRGQSYYRCTECSVDFHVSCAATVGDSSNGAQQARHDTLNRQREQLQYAQMIARIQAQGARNVAYMSGAYPESYTVWRDYYF